MVDASPEDYEEYVNQKGDGWALCFEEDAPLLQVPAHGLRHPLRRRQPGPPAL